VRPTGSSPEAGCSDRASSALWGRRAGLAAALAVTLAAPAAADAFCGFYVSGADAALFNNATQVVLMRSGTRTVLSMQNNYEGPAEDFAMVVPVPVVLQKENVKTLPREIFQRVDQLSAPRLVEYWEQDPCGRMMLEEGKMAKADSRRVMGASPARRAEQHGVTIEAKFTVGEYQILILSAKEATGLDTWLREEKYRIPDGAEPYLKPYVEGGSKFFVAKVDSSKVKFENGRAQLSPLRFHYESSEFSLPIRLGMMNSAGTQDLIVHILAPGQRYEVANYANVTIPTNLDVREEARGRFGEFYAALFDRTLEKNKGAVVTEYSWDAGSCDPCPSPALSFQDLSTLGSDVVGGGGGGSMGRGRMGGGGFVLTRLHARYAKDGISEDLIFKAAPPIAGGREWRGPEGKLEEGNVPSPVNNFQGRYAIRHEWTGPIACASPVRGIWGGPPAGSQQVSAGPVAATDLAFVKRGAIELAQVVRSDVPEIGLVAGAAAPEEPTTTVPKEDPVATPEKHSPKKEKKGCAAGGSSGGLALAGLALLALLRRRRR
jgi:uncharacterized protein (TIGR03382 family)